MQPLCQPFCSGVGDLTPEVIPLVIVHELQCSPQVLQQVQHPEATQEGRGGWLAVKEPVGVIHRLGACGYQKGRMKDNAGTRVVGSECQINCLIHPHLCVLLHKAAATWLVRKQEVVNWAWSLFLKKQLYALCDTHDGRCHSSGLNQTAWCSDSTLSIILLKCQPWWTCQTVNKQTVSISLQ